MVGQAAVGGFALVLELLEVAEGLAELAQQVSLVLDEVVELAGLGDDALLAKVLDLALQAASGALLGVALALGLVDGVGKELVGIAVVGGGEGGVGKFYWGTLLALAGDVALVAGDAVQQPEDEGDALGESGLQGVVGVAPRDGEGAVVLPLVGGFEPGR